jgi:PEP-CTERM motif
MKPPTLAALRLTGQQAANAGRRSAGKVSHLVAAAVIAAASCTAQALPILTEAKVEPVQSTTVTSRPGLLSDAALDLQTAPTTDTPLTVLEPGSLVLFGIGLIALGLWRRGRTH